MIAAWLGAFVFTQAIEMPVYAAALRGRPHHWLRAFGASACTHPVVFFVFPRVWPGDYAEQVLAAEAFAVAGEALYLGLQGVERSVLWSLAANALSASLGLISRAAFGWP
ncbi:MAG: hypothetical protein KC620_23095 [Myxococcales bacterium]|nr:hypothetical protein [Myxococcales bacterium]